MSHEESPVLDKSLEAVYAFLSANGFACFLTPPDSGLPTPHLLIGLGKDAKERDYVLKINFLLIPKPNKMELEQLPISKDSYMQFVITFPFKGKKEHEKEYLRMIAFLNATLEIPGFGFNEVLSEFHFRYVYFSEEPKLYKGWLLSFILYLRGILDLFAPWLEDVSHGKVTVNELAAKLNNVEFQDMPTFLKSLSEER